MRIALLKRQIALWLALRILQVPLLILAAAGPAGAPIGRQMVEPQPAVVLLTAALGLIELRRRHELILVGNLGITRTQVAAILVVPALIIESVIGLLGSF